VSSGCIKIEISQTLLRLINGESQPDEIMLGYDVIKKVRAIFSPILFL